MALPNMALPNMGLPNMGLPDMALPDDGRCGAMTRKTPYRQSQDEVDHRRALKKSRSSVAASLSPTAEYTSGT